MVEAAPPRWRLPLAALTLGALLSAGWTRANWARLGVGLLPDGDDMMRLAQVLDWVDGQAFGDLVQHRLGDGVTSVLHWSRLADLGPAALMLALRPLAGPQAAEIWTAVLWPSILFVAYLLTAVGLARRAGGAALAMPALVVAALAFPAITMFVPGRIDHHGLQIVLVLLLVETLLRPPSGQGGVLAGVLMAASLAIGLETGPVMVIALGVMFALLVVDDRREGVRAQGFALGLLGATLAWRMIAQPANWSPLWCDGFGPASFDATLIAGAAWLALAVAARREEWRMRLGLALVVAGIAGAAAYATSSVCLAGPYGGTDPLLRRLWMDRIEEARPLIDHRGQLAILLGFGALPILGPLAAAAAWRTTRDRRWLILLAFGAMALGVTLAQARGAAVAAALAVPSLAWLVVQARMSGRPAPVVFGWAASAGLVWTLIGGTADRARAAPIEAGDNCDDPRLFAALRALRPGTVIATIDIGSPIVALTPHRVLAAPYHRNNAGNRATYDFWLRPEAEARAIAHRWRADYVLFCRAGFGGIDLKREGPGGMAERLSAGQAPTWLRRVVLPLDGPLLYRILPLARPSD